ncbi:MAG: hypothetical protein KGD70_02920 [Candidatus Lokiarchaeota archaeon]|jgi:hypothetical protein|nr:hypothetical protein [Candidatus Lokiarchaeota archaeon]
MSRKIDTSAQFIEFYIKKGHYLVELSENHFKNKEYKKCLELLSQAHGMFEKGGAKEEAEKVKLKFTDIKKTFFKNNSNQ